MEKRQLVVGGSYFYFLWYLLEGWNKFLISKVHHISMGTRLILGIRIEVCSNWINCNISQVYLKRF